jgi:hypothetical protein
LLLVHTIFAGTLLLCFKEIKNAWRNKPQFNKILAIVLYLVFILISLKLYFASPTKSNRFFNLNALPHDKLMFFINDRLRYYSESLLNPIARILLITPLLYSLFAIYFRKKFTPALCLSLILLSVLVSFFVVKSIIIFAVILLITPFVNIFRNKNSQDNKILLLFSISAIIILGVLMITVMLVKTQLTELSFVLLVISGVYWSRLLKDMLEVSKPLLSQKKNIRIILSIGCLAFVAIIYFSYPALKAKEQLLSQVRDVRTNANDAIKWMGANLPRNSEVLVTAPSLYGLGGEDEMTAKDDQYKLYAQYTFLQGYTRSYFRALNRDDLALGYLEDSLKLSRILDSCRNQSKYYLFLQTGLDVDRFHSQINGIKPFKSRDSLLAKFSNGPFPSEIWEIRK